MSLSKYDILLLADKVQKRLISDLDFKDKVFLLMSTKTRFEVLLMQEEAIEDGDDEAYMVRLAASSLFNVAEKERKRKSQ